MTKGKNGTDSGLPTAPICVGQWAQLPRLESPDGLAAFAHENGATCCPSLAVQRKGLCNLMQDVFCSNLSDRGGMEELAIKRSHVSRVASRYCNCIVYAHTVLSLWIEQAKLVHGVRSWLVRGALPCVLKGRPA